MTLHDVPKTSELAWLVARLPRVPIGEYWAALIYGLILYFIHIPNGFLMPNDFWGPPRNPWRDKSCLLAFEILNFKSDGFTDILKEIRLNCNIPTGREIILNGKRKFSERNRFISILVTIKTAFKVFWKNNLLLFLKL